MLTRGVMDARGSRLGCSLLTASGSHGSIVLDTVINHTRTGGHAVLNTASHPHKCGALGPGHREHFVPWIHGSLSVQKPCSAGKHGGRFCSAVLTTSLWFPKTSCVSHFPFHILVWSPGLCGTDIIDHCLVILTLCLINYSNLTKKRRQRVI